MRTILLSLCLLACAPDADSVAPPSPDTAPRADSNWTEKDWQAWEKVWRAMPLTVYYSSYSPYSPTPVSGAVPMVCRGTTDPTYSGAVEKVQKVLQEAVAQDRRDCVDSGGRFSFFDGRAAFFTQPPTLEDFAAWQSKFNPPWVPTPGDGPAWRLVDWTGDRLADFLLTAPTTPLLKQLQQQLVRYKRHEWSVGKCQPVVCVGAKQPAANGGSLFDGPIRPIIR
jgi:hypothetical protein